MPDHYTLQLVLPSYETEFASFWVVLARGMVIYADDDEATARAVCKDLNACA